MLYTMNFSNSDEEEKIDDTIKLEENISKNFSNLSSIFVLPDDELSRTVSTFSSLIPQFSYEIERESLNIFNMSWNGEFLYSTFKDNNNSEKLYISTERNNNIEESIGIFIIYSKEIHFYSRNPYEKIIEIQILIDEKGNKSFIGKFLKKNLNWSEEIFINNIINDDDLRQYIIFDKFQNKLLILKENDTEFFNFEILKNIKIFLIFGICIGLLLFDPPKSLKTSNLFEFDSDDE